MNIPYKYRGIALLAGLILLLPSLAWHFALHDTARLWLDCYRLETELRGFAPLLPNTPDTEPVSELVLSGGVLDTLRNSALDGIRIIGYEPVLTLRQESAAIHTARISMTGDFTSLLHTVARLEQRLPDCRLRTMEWCAENNSRKREKNIILTIYIQQLTQ